MNTHKHARLTFALRIEMVKQMTLEGLDAVRAAAAQGVTAPTARKWLGRYLAGCEAALANASSRPLRCPTAIDAGKALLIVELCKRRVLQARISRSVGVSASTVSRVLSRAGHVPAERSGARRGCRALRARGSWRPAAHRHQEAGAYRAAQSPRHWQRKDAVDGAGWETLFAAIDDHARIVFTAMYPDEKKPQAVLFLQDAVAYYTRLSIIIKRLLTDNGSAFRSREFTLARVSLGIKHKFTRAYRPQTNGKAERFIQSALREWA